MHGAAHVLHHTTMHGAAHVLHHPAMHGPTHTVHHTTTLLCWHAWRTPCERSRLWRRRRPPSPRGLHGAVRGTVTATGGQLTLRALLRTPPRCSHACGTATATATAAVHGHGASLLGAGYASACMRVGGEIVRVGTRAGHIVRRTTAGRPACAYNCATCDTYGRRTSANQPGPAPREQRASQARHRGAPGMVFARPDTMEDRGFAAAATPAGVHPWPATRPLSESMISPQWIDLRSNHNTTPVMPRLPDDATAVPDHDIPAVIRLPWTHARAPKKPVQWWASRTNPRHVLLGLNARGDVPMTSCNFATAMCYSRNQLLTMAQVPPNQCRRQRVREKAGP